MDEMRHFHERHDRDESKPWAQCCSGDVKVSSSLLSSSIYSYPYFVEEDLQTPSTLQKARNEKILEQQCAEKKLQNLRRVCHYPSSPSSFMTHSQSTMKAAKSVTRRFQKEEPSALKKFDKKFYKNVASESSLKKVSRPKSPCTALSPIKLAQVLKSKTKKVNDPKSKLTTIAPTQSNPLNAPYKQIKKRKNIQPNKKVGVHPEPPNPIEQVALKGSKSCGTYDSTKGVSQSYSMTIAKITLNEDDKGVFVPFSWLEKFDAEEIRLKLIKKELSRIPKPIGMDSQYYKSRQSTLICKIARAGSI